MQLGKPLEGGDVALPEIGSADVWDPRSRQRDLLLRCALSRRHLTIDPLPLTLGHEVAGRVETVGDEVDHVSPGDCVYVNYL